ncbi:hypothetical protein FB45DRAFT_1002762 [Roridomyces roridus]|uniref:Uncharacterized protein n=1 Tax=Roridomyces roridus TaxID=1738132 RepID=A0AAD7BVX5_9AGAR|nr:hypothetical protein FB45DRAFT_1002762 [Roridomyces roridus]
MATFDDYSLADLRSFDGPYYKCWPPVEPWNTLLTPIISPPLYLDQPPVSDRHLLLFCILLDNGHAPTTAAYNPCGLQRASRGTHPAASITATTFLQFELLPSVDEDLSHPPYTRRAAAMKRKRVADEDAARPQKQRRSTNVHTQPVHSGPRTRSFTRQLRR